MIQEIFPHRFDNHYLADNEIREKDYILHYNGNSLLLKANGNEFEIPQRKDFPEINNQTESTFLFTLNDTSCFLVWDDLKESNSLFVYREINFSGLSVNMK